MQKIRNSVSNQTVEPVSRRNSIHADVSIRITIYDCHAYHQVRQSIPSPRMRWVSSTLKGSLASVRSAKFTASRLVERRNLCITAQALSSISMFVRDILLSYTSRYNMKKYSVCDITDEFLKCSRNSSEVYRPPVTSRIVPVQ